MIAYFINLSIIIIIESKVLPVTRSFDFGSLITKSIITSFHGVSRTGVNCICLYLAWRADLFYWY